MTDPLPAKRLSKRAALQAVPSIDTLRRRRKPPKVAKAFTSVSFDQIAAEVQEFTDEPWLPEGVLCLIVGREGMGKGLAEAWLAARHTTGACTAGDIGNVGLLTFEDDQARQVRPRLDVAGADVTRVFTMTVPGRRDRLRLLLDLPTDLPSVRSFIEDNSLRLLMLDPLTSTLDAELKTGEETSMRSLLEQLNDLAAATRCTILGVVHFNKSTGVDVLDRIMHSKAFSAVSRHTMALGWWPDDPTGKRRAIVVAKSNVGPVGQALAFDIASEDTGMRKRNGEPFTVGRLVPVHAVDWLDPRDVLDRPQAEREGTKTTEIKAVLAEYIRTHGTIEHDPDHGDLLVVKSDAALAHVTHTVGEFGGAVVTRAREALGVEACRAPKPNPVPKDWNPHWIMRVKPERVAYQHVADKA